MDPLDLSVVEILDHLGRRAARLGVPAPRRTDRVGDWCALGAEEEAHLREYLSAAHPGWADRHEDAGIYGFSFEQLMRELRAK